MLEVRMSKTTVLGTLSQYCTTGESNEIFQTGLFLAQVSGEHHNLTINSSDRVTIDRAARLHASASFLCAYIFMHVQEQTNERARELGWHPR